MEMEFKEKDVSDADAAPPSPMTTNSKVKFGLHL